MTQFVVQRSLIDEYPIFLVGMMGAGKTTLGRHLAKLLNCQFVDTDHLIQERCGVSIPTIFEIEGELAFRQREAAVLKECGTYKKAVIATGGGIVMLSENRDFLSSQPLVVYLRGRPDDLFARVRLDPNRPLLKAENPHEKFRTLYSLRDPLYKEVANHTLDTGKQSINKLMGKMMTIVCTPLVESRDEASRR